MTIGFSTDFETSYLEKSSYRVVPFKITKEHLDDPDAFSRDELPEESKIRFSYDLDGRVNCPISIDEINPESSCYKVECCNRVYLQDSLKNWLKKSPNCPFCYKHLITKNILPYLDLGIKLKKITLFITIYAAISIFDCYVKGKLENVFVNHIIKYL